MSIFFALAADTVLLRNRDCRADRYLPACAPLPVLTKKAKRERARRSGKCGPPCSSGFPDRSPVLDDHQRSTGRLAERAGGSEGTLTTLRERAGGVEVCKPTKIGPESMVQRLMAA